MSKKKPAFIFTTMDFFGNQVTLSAETWNTHIITEHAPMVGYENLVEVTLKNPHEVRESTFFEAGIAFISEPGAAGHAEGIRVLVAYTDTHYQKGASKGKVTTAYPVDILRYSSPQLGRTIYKKKGEKK